MGKLFGHVRDLESCDSTEDQQGVVNYKVIDILSELISWLFIIDINICFSKERKNSLDVLYLPVFPFPLSFSIARHSWHRQVASSQRYPRWDESEQCRFQMNRESLKWRKKKKLSTTPPSLMTVPVEPCHPPNHLPQSPKSTSATFRSKLMPALLLWSPASCIWVTLLPSSQAQERQSAFPAEKMHEDLQKHFALWVSFGTFYFNSQQINPTRFLNLSGLNMPSHCMSSAKSRRGRKRPLGADRRMEGWKDLGQIGYYYTNSSGPKFPLLILDHCTSSDRKPKKRTNAKPPIVHRRWKCYAP